MEDRNRVISSFFWRFSERMAARLVAVIVEIILARLLAPEAYGTIALITVFTTILNVFVDSGLGNALVQKKDADQTDFSTVFFANIGFCVFLYALVFISAPLIAKFYNDSELIPLIRVLSLTIVVSGVKNIQHAYVSKHLLFKSFFFATLAGTVGAGIIGIYMAYAGYGVWALVAQMLFNTTVDTIVLWFTVKWRPSFEFSISRLKQLFSYGWKLLASTLLDTVYNDLRQLVIGKMYSPSDLAYYNKAQQFPQLIISNINTSINSVLFPTMSKAQDERAVVKMMTRRSIQISTYIMAPLMMGLAFTAPIVIRIVLTDKWLPAVPYLRIFCITYMFYPIHTSNLSAIKAVGRSDIYLKLEILKKIVGTLLLVATMWFGVMAMAYSLLVNSLCGQLINTWPNRKLLDYKYIDQLKDILPNILLAVFMGVIVSLLPLLKLPDIPTLIFQIIIGAVVYISASRLFKNESFNYLLVTIKKFIQKRRKEANK